MEPRRNEEQARRQQRQIHVPQRTGFRRAPIAVPPQSEPVIPLLDEETPDIKSPLFIQRMQRAGKKLSSSPKKSFAVILVLVTVGYTGTHLVQKKSTATDVKGTTTAIPVEAGTALERNAKPAFSTVVPDGKSIEELGGWTRISPKERAPVYAYADKLDGVAIRVSQQEIPANLSADSEKANQGVQELAASFKADQKLTIGNTIAFIGTSAKGPQSVIFAKNELLILITSDKKIDNDLWTAYISSLE